MAKGEGTVTGHSNDEGEASGDAHDHAGYWTCGMHPQIVEDEPGTCSICGMDLVHKEK